MPKYIPAADKIADGLFAAKNRLFDLVQRKIDEGKDEKEIMKELKEGYTADPSVLSEIEYTFFKKKAKKVAFIPQIIFSDLLHDINSLWEDGYIAQAELNTILEKYGELEEDIMHFALDETKAANIFDNFVGPFLTIAEEREEITEQANTGLITEQEKKDRLTRVSTTKKVSFNPYKKVEKTKKASWIEDAKVGDQVELNDEVGEVTYIGSDKVEVKTPTKTETIWKN